MHQIPRESTICNISRKGYYPGKEAKIEDSDGNEKLVKELPIEIDINEVIGKPVLIQVKHRTYTNKDGEEKIAANEAGIYDWPNGEVKDMGDDDLPF